MEMVKQSFSMVMIWNHPIEITVYKSGQIIATENTTKNPER